MLASQLVRRLNASAEGGEADSHASSTEHALTRVGEELRRENEGVSLSEAFDRAMGEARAVREAEVDWRGGSGGLRRAPRHKLPLSLMPLDGKLTSKVTGKAAESGEVAGGSVGVKWEETTTNKLGTSPWKVALNRRANVKGLEGKRATCAAFQESVLGKLKESTAAVAADEAQPEDVATSVKRLRQRVDENQAHLVGRIGALESALHSLRLNTRLEALEDMLRSVLENAGSMQSTLTPRSSRSSPNHITRAALSKKATRGRGPEISISTESQSFVSRTGSRHRHRRESRDASTESQSFAARSPTRGHRERHPNRHRATSTDGPTDLADEIREIREAEVASPRIERMRESESPTSANGQRHFRAVLDRSRYSRQLRNAGHASRSSPFEA